MHNSELDGYRDDRMYVMRITSNYTKEVTEDLIHYGASLDVDEDIDPGKPVILITYRNLGSLSAQRIDEFPTRSDAVNYAMKVETECPRVSLRGRSPFPTPSWQTHCEWLRDNGHVSAIDSKALISEILNSMSAGGTNPRELIVLPRRGADRASEAATMSSNWLEAYLSAAVREELCTKINCTTCGATAFRKGVLGALAKATGEPLRQSFYREGNIEIAKALADVRPSIDTARPIENAVMCLLNELWSGMPFLDREIESLMVGSRAGEILNRMKAHHEARETKRHDYEASQDPAAVQRRREEKKRLNQERHEERLALKRERDRLWHAQNVKAD